jgi:hypothetical protein
LHQPAQKDINLEILMPVKVLIPSMAEEKEFVSKNKELEQQITVAQAITRWPRPRRGNNEKVPVRMNE